LPTKNRFCESSQRLIQPRPVTPIRDFAINFLISSRRPEEWLLIEWPEGEKKPAKYWLSTLPKNITFRKLVDLTKLRWRIERDYQGTRLARLPSPRHAVHRGLRISGLGEGDDFPLGTSFRHCYWQYRLVLLRQKLRRLCLIDRLQHGHRERRPASDDSSLRRMVAIEFGM